MKIRLILILLICYTLTQNTSHYKYFDDNTLSENKTIIVMCTNDISYIVNESDKKLL